MLPISARVDLGVMAMKGYSALPKAPALLDQMQFSAIFRTLIVGGVVYSSAEKLLAYSTETGLSNIRAKQKLCNIVVI